MTEYKKENPQESSENTQETIKNTKKSLSILEKETRVNIFRSTWNRLKNLFSPEEAQWQSSSVDNLPQKNTKTPAPSQELTKNTENKEKTEKENTKKETKESQETTKTWSDKISNEMFEQLLKMEGKHKKEGKLVAKKGKQFWEWFPTWPFGMPYRHIDNEGNLLKKAIPFKEWEEVTEEWARKNAKACYDKRAKEIKEAFDKKWYKISQNQLDALTSTCGWTSKSRKNCLNYALDNRKDQKKVVEYISTHSTTAAWNGKVMPGLVYRRKFEADWFVWNKMTFAEHRSKQKKWKNTNSNDSYLA